MFQIKKLRSKLASFALLAFSLVLTFVLVEAAIRYQFGYKYAPPKYPPQPQSESFQQVNFGYRLQPSQTTTYWHPHVPPQREIVVVANSDGFRGSRDLNGPDPRPRVLVLGDSFVLGDGVQEEERFTNMLENEQPRWRIDNLGMSGYGPDLMLRALEAVGLGLDPDVVVICLYSDDFRRIHPHYAGVGFLIPRFELESGRLVTVPYPEPRLWDRLHTVQLASRTYWNYSKWAFDLHGAILDRFLELGELHGFKPAFVFLPGKNDLRVDRTRRTWLRQYAQEHSVAFLDLSDPIHEARERQQLFLKKDPHYNAAGHRIVAHELGEFMTQHVLND